MVFCNVWALIDSYTLSLPDALPIYNVATIIADSAELSRDIDLRRARYAKERAEKRIEKAKQTHDVDDRRRGEVALARAINRIRVSEHH